MIYFFSNKNNLAKRGFSLVEILIYIFIMTIVLAAITNAVYSISTSYRTMRSADIVETSAIASLDRMVREIHDATSIDAVNSTLDSSPGVLTLNTTDDSGAATTIQFYVSSQVLRVKEAGVDIGPLTDSSARVTNLVFRSITTAQSKAVKIEMTIESGANGSYRSRSFYTTAVFRGSYAP